VTDKTFKIIVFSAIVLAVFGLYFPSLQNGFVFDDEQIAINNSQVASLKNIGKAFTSCIWEPQLQTCYERTNYYRPLHTLSIMFATAVSDSPFVFHLVNIIYYIVFCWLVFILLNRLFKNRSVSVLGTAIFLFHPLHAESAMWISGLPELLMGIFAVWAFLVHDSENKKWISGFLFFLALLSKETAIALIPVLFVYDYLYKEKKINLDFLKNYIPYASFFVLYFVMRVSAIGFSKKIPFDFGVSFWEKTSAGIIAFGLYFKKIFLPWPLSPLIPIESGIDAGFWVGLVFVLFFILMIILWIPRQARNDKKSVIPAKAGIQFQKILSLGLSIYAFFLIPPLLSMFTAFTKGDLVIADRYLSFPLLGVAIIFGYFGGKIYESARGWIKPVLAVVFIAIIAFWGQQTYAQNKVWNSSQSLYERVQSTNKERGIESNKTTFNLALIYEKNGKITEANELYAKVISRAGDFPLSASQAANQLGLFYMGQGDLGAAKALFEKAIEIFPANSAPKNNLDLLKNGVK
jgi:tetratricopeptide (TPR) repeat protein